MYVAGMLSDGPIIFSSESLRQQQQTYGLSCGSPESGPQADLHTIMIKFDMKPTQQIRNKIRVVKGALYLSATCAMNGSVKRIRSLGTMKQNVHVRSKITHKY